MVAALVERNSLRAVARMTGVHRTTPCWFIGRRHAGAAHHFIQDLKERLANRVQLTTDGRRPYLEAVGDTFGKDICDAAKDLWAFSG